MSEMMKNLAITGLLALATSAAALPGVAQQSAAPAVTTTSVAVKTVVETEDETATVPAKPGLEGIKVHGHWIIDVKDKDGKIVEHRDFQNSLDPTFGGLILARLLNGSFVASDIEIVASGNSFSQTMYVSGSASASGCGSTCLPNATETLVINNNGVATLALTGQFTPSAAQTITTVATAVETCSISGNSAPLPVTPRDCHAATGISAQNAGYSLASYPFTGTNIAPLSMAAGQTLAISVTLSFS